LESFAESSAQWPVLNILGALLRDWMPLIDEYHYCKFVHPHSLPCAHLRIQIRPPNPIHVLVHIIYYSNPCRELLCHCSRSYLRFDCASVYGYLHLLFSSRCPYYVPISRHHCCFETIFQPEFIPISTPTDDQLTVTQFVHSSSHVAPS